MSSEDEILLTTVNFIKNYLLDSSSSSSSEEEFSYAVPKVKRQRIPNFIDDAVHQYSAEEFKRRFHVTRKTANYLIDKYEKSSHYKKRNYKGGRLQASAEHHMLSFLWFAANKHSFREVSNIFNITKSSFHMILNKVISFLVDDIALEIIKFPTDTAGKEHIAKEFEKISGFPNVLGCIIESYIPIRNVKEQNSNNQPFITVQGICDSELRFLDIFICVPSKIHSGTIFDMSTISKNIEIICEKKYHLLGDDIYGIRSYLLTSYNSKGSRRNLLSEFEKEYNLKFSQTKSKIDEAFRNLKNRFQQIMRLDFRGVFGMSRFLMACCTLHNICINNSDLWIIDESNNDDNDEEDNYVTYRNPRTENSNNSEERHLGERKRSQIKKAII